MSKQKDDMGFLLLQLSGEMEFKLTTELKFHPTRRWRFDWAIEKWKVAIEYEGIYGGKKSRHTTVSGYTKDTEKYNEAAKLGWRVLRYTAKNFGNVFEDLKHFNEENNNAG
jgi:very-short-patch-repair endonuclease